ncbi:hypothetical protein [Cupriavidus agavae]|nr:hypothetical protein [Cupriavidus agavae]
MDIRGGGALGAPATTNGWAESIGRQFGALDAKLCAVREQMLERFGILDRRLAGVETRTDGLDHRLDRVKAKVDQIDTRLGNIENKVARIEARLDDTATKADLHAALNGQTWRLVTFVTGFGSALVAATFFLARSVL